MSRELSAVLPVREVLLTEDRGLITRAGTVAWPGGAGTIRVEGVSPVVMDATLQATTAGDALEVSRAAVVRRWIPDTEQRDALYLLKEKAEALGEQLQQRQRDAQRSGQRLERALALVERYLERVRWLLQTDQADPTRWGADLDALEARIDAALADSHRADEALREVTEAQAALARAREAATTGWKPHAAVELSVDGGPGPVEVSLRYLVPNAVWRPSYVAHLQGEGTMEVTVMATVWQRTGEDWSDARLVLSTARPSTGATLPPLFTDRLSLRDKTTEERRTIQAALYEQQIHSASLTDSGEAGLPGVADGGEARALAADGLVSVPADGRPRRVTITRFRADVSAQSVCMPAQKALVFERVELANATASPLLAGPVTVITDGGPAGVAKLPYVAPGERFTLSLGSQDDVVVDYSRSATVEKRLALSDRRWLLQRAALTRTGSGPESVEVVLRLPVSELAQVRVVMDSDDKTTKGYTGPDEQGFVRWQVSLPLDQTRAVTLAFRLDRDSNVNLPDPW